MSRLLGMALVFGLCACAVPGARAQITDPGSPVPPADSIVAPAGLSVAEDAPSTPPADSGPRVASSARRMRSRTMSSSLGLRVFESSS